VLMFCPGHIICVCCMESGFNGSLTCVKCGQHCDLKQFQELQV